MSKNNSDLDQQALDCHEFPKPGKLKLEGSKPYSTAVDLSLAELAREPVPDEVLKAYNKTHMQYGPDYIIPTQFDPRLHRISERVKEVALQQIGTAVT